MDSKCLRWLRIVYLPLLWEECVISYKARALFYYCYAGVCRYLQGDNRQLTRVFLCPSASLLPSASADGLKDLEAKPLPLWVFNPFHRLHLKGLKTTEEPAKPGTIIYPSAEADGKREPAKQGKPRLLAHCTDMQCPGTVSAHPKAGGIPILNRAGTALLPA